MTLNYRQDAQNIVDGLGHLIDGLQYDTVKTKVTRKEWAKPQKVRQLYLLVILMVKMLISTTGEKIISNTITALLWQ